MNQHPDVDPSYLKLLAAKRQVADQIQHDPLLRHHRPGMLDCGERLTSLYQAAPRHHRFFCQKRFCPVCQLRKQHRWKHKVLNWLPAIEHQYPKAKWLFLTLTVRHPPVGEVKYMLTNHMQRAFDRLKERKFWKDNVHGYLRFTEVVPDKEHPGYANPHYHVLLLVRPSMFEGVNSLKQSDWKEVWGECLGQLDTPEAHCKRVHIKPYQPLEKDLSNLVCYCTKPLHQDYEPEGDWLRERIHQLRGVQMVTAGGAFWRVARQIVQEDICDAQTELLPPRSRELDTYIDDDGALCLDVICPPDCTLHDH